MDLFNRGTCEYCGPTHMIPVPVETPDKADEQAALLCSCIEGERWRQMMGAKTTVAALFADMQKDAVDLLLHIVLATRNGLIESSSLKMSGSVVAKVKLSKGLVMVSRQDKQERQQSV